MTRTVLSSPGRPAHRWPAVDDPRGIGPRPGVFVVDADNARRRATVRLLATRTDLVVVGDHPGSDGIVAEVVGVLPHVCVVGSRIAVGRPPDLVEELRRALPATRCLRVPRSIGVDRRTMSTSERLRLDDESRAFLRDVLVAAGLPAGVA